MEVDHDGQQNNILCRVERASPSTDWERSWRLARLPGLGTENVSFLFKLLHDILPTQERVSRTKTRASPACPVLGCGDAVETRAHALLLCEGNNGVGQRVMRCLRNCSRRRFGITLGVVNCNSISGNMEVEGRQVQGAAL